MTTIRRHDAFIGEDKALTIYGDTNLLDDYIGGLALTTGSGIGVTRQESVNGHNRKRYPGDAGVQVGGHTRTVIDVVLEPGVTLPGFRFWCERPTGTGENRRSNARQFNYVGNWGDLVSYATANAVGAPYTLRNSSGRSVRITD